MHPSNPSQYKVRIREQRAIIAMAKLFVVLTTIMFMVIMLNPSRARAQAQTPDEPSPTWAKTIVGDYHNEKKTVLQYYFHERVNGESPNSVQVVYAPNSTQPFTGFGYMGAADVPLRVGPDPDSKIVGRSHGLYVSTSADGTGLLMSLTQKFNDGIYNGSSISIQGLNEILLPVREMAVTGGTGLFRLVRGYAVLHTSVFDPVAGIAIVGYNLTLFH